MHTADVREQMIEQQVRAWDVLDERVLACLRRVPRELFVPEALRYRAYADVEVAYAPGRWLLKGRDIGKLLQAVRPQPGERALAIAAPYAAAVMEAMGLTVTRLDGEDLTKPDGAYDVVICEGAVAEVPLGWLAVLGEPGARLGAVQRSGPIGRALLYLRTDTGVGRRDLFDCGVPIMAGFEPQSAFTF